MSEHEILGWLLAGSIVVVAASLVVACITVIALGRMLRESQRLTRAVAAMVYQEGEKTRAALGRPPA